MKSIFQNATPSVSSRDSSAIAGSLAAQVRQTRPALSQALYNGGMNYLYSLRRLRLTVIGWGTAYTTSPNKDQRHSFRRSGYFDLRIGQSDGSDMVTERWSEERNVSLFLRCQSAEVIENYL